MKKKNYRTHSEGRAQPEIRPGDKWKDNGGSVVTIVKCSFNRVVYIREGYEHPCICTPGRLYREFSRLKKETFTSWTSTSNPAEMAARLREIINDEGVNNEA
ncbi:DUF4222 domain-containing protein [Scandinavium goeteborgense]|uniref:DUF4222 domain-containing protein n=1 Tax=Scandinavium goeteborgense TaxID=1851514 RepID=UPI0038182DD7